MAKGKGNKIKSKSDKVQQQQQEQQVTPILMPPLPPKLAKNDEKRRKSKTPPLRSKKVTPTPTPTLTATPTPTSTLTPFSKPAYAPKSSVDAPKQIIDVPNDATTAVSVSACTSAQSSSSSSTTTTVKPIATATTTTTMLSNNASMESIKSNYSIKSKRSQISLKSSASAIGNNNSDSDVKDVDSGPVAVKGRFSNNFKNFLATYERNACDELISISTSISASTSMTGNSNQSRISPQISSMGMDFHDESDVTDSGSDSGSGTSNPSSSISASTRPSPLMLEHHGQQHISITAAAAAAATTSTAAASTSAAAAAAAAMVKPNDAPTKTTTKTAITQLNKGKRVFCNIRPNAPTFITNRAATKRKPNRSLKNMRKKAKPSPEQLELEQKLIQLLKSGDMDGLYNRSGHLYDDDLYDFDDEELEYLYSSSDPSYEELPINTQNVTNNANKSNTMDTRMENSPEQMENMPTLPIMPDINSAPIISSPPCPPNIIATDNISLPNNACNRNNKRPNNSGQSVDSTINSNSKTTINTMSKKQKKAEKLQKQSDAFTQILLEDKAKREGKKLEDKLEKAWNLTKSKKIPLLFLPRVKNIQVIHDRLTKIEGIGNKYTTLCMPNGSVRLQSCDMETYQKIASELHHMDDVESHTHQKRSERGYRVVIKRLHSSTDWKWVHKELMAMGYKPRYIRVMQDRYTGRRKNVFQVELEPTKDGKNESILNVKLIGNQVVSVAKMWKSIDPAQCHRCQAFGHTRNYCRREFVCLRCAGRHMTKSCPKPRDTPGTCANCNGAHIASYRGCRVFKTEQRKMAINKARGKVANIMHGEEAILKELMQPPIRRHTNRQNTYNRHHKQQQQQQKHQQEQRPIQQRKQQQQPIKQRQPSQQPKQQHNNNIYKNPQLRQQQQPNTHQQQPLKTKRIWHKKGYPIKRSNATPQQQQQQHELQQQQTQTKPLNVSKQNMPNNEKSPLRPNNGPASRHLYKLQSRLQQEQKEVGVNNNVAAMVTQHASHITQMSEKMDKALEAINLLLNSGSLPLQQHSQQ